jgi:hypothetical protein
LRALGFSAFEVLKRRPDEQTRDFAIDTKNLRAHECAEYVMPQLFGDRKIKGFDFSGIGLIIRRSFRGTLNLPEQQRILTIIDEIRTYPTHQATTVSLSNRAWVAFEIVEGNGDVRGEDAADLSTDVDAFQGLLRKIAANIRVAIEQVYSPSAQDAEVKIIAMRWDIPLVSLPFPAALTEACRQSVATELSAIGREANAVSYPMPKRSPKHTPQQSVGNREETSGSLPSVSTSAVFSFLKDSRGALTWKMRDFQECLNIGAKDARQIWRSFRCRDASSKRTTRTNI